MLSSNFVVLSAPSSAWCPKASAGHVCSEVREVNFKLDKNINVQATLRVGSVQKPLSVV